MTRQQPGWPESPTERDKKRHRDRSWWPVIAAAIIGAAATIVAGLIANGAGALRISVTPAHTATVTITAPPPPAPTVTVTVSSGGSSDANCRPGQNCKVYNLSVPLPASDGENGIDMDMGHVLLGNVADMEFQTDSNDGVPELIGRDAQAYSIDVTSQNASKEQCQTAVNSDPDANPITDFHAGLLFCVYTGNSGIALVRQTKPLDSSNILDLQETYWPNSG
jgi:hypothetical protein